MEKARLAGVALALGAAMFLLLPAAPARAQTAEDECHKITRKAPYAKQRAVFDKCMAEKTKGKGKKG